MQQCLVICLKNNMGIYGTFNYGYIFKKSSLTEDELNILLSLNDRFSVNKYDDIITMSDKHINIENSGLGIEMYDIEKETLTVQEYVGSHENKDGIIMREYKTKKYSRNENEHSLECGNKNCYYCYGFSNINDDILENEEAKTNKKRKCEFDKLDFLGQEIVSKITYSGWFNIVFCSVDMSVDVHIPLKYKCQ